MNAVPPWLSHLRTDRRGIPVPWVNYRGSTDPASIMARTRTGHDPHVGAQALFTDDDPAGDPDFTQQHMGRQRKAMAVGLCQVCGRPVPWSRRFLVVADISVEQVTITLSDGSRAARPVVTEPWLDARCLRFAVDHCPALIRRARSERLHEVAVTSQRQVVQVVSTGWSEGPLREATQTTPHAMWVKVVLRHWDLTLTHRRP